jgi:thioester reductase-like protein
MNTSISEFFSIQELFCQQVQRTPHQIAVFDQGCEITYAQLDIQSDKISYFLQEQGIQPNELVALFMESSYDFVLACISILKAGAAFMPISVELPIPAIKDILVDAQPRLLLSHLHYQDLLPQDQRWQCIDQSYVLQSNFTPSSYLQPCVPTQPQNLAFATYTSGTTGSPKGVLQVQEAMCISYAGRSAFAPYQAQERVACNIFFMWECLRPLVRGACCYVIPDQIVYVPQKLAQYLHEHKITETLFTPSAFQRLLRSCPSQLLQQSFSHLKTIWLNGEVVTGDLLDEARQILPSTIRLLNTYSICECHDVSHFDTAEYDSHIGNICPVGYASLGTKAYVYRNGVLCTQGEGELYVAGDNLGTGYLNLPKLSQERFPLIKKIRCYATGDLADINEYGLISIKGRTGSMVKIRGYSVYLGAIETALRKHCYAKDAIIQVHGAHLSQRLVAYVIPSHRAEWEIDSNTQTSPHLRKILLEQLPAYMVPNKFIELEQFPIDIVSGKLDIKALKALEKQILPLSPSLTEQANTDATSSSEFASTPNALTIPYETFKVLWAHALSVTIESIQDEDDFFLQGGHSLSAVDFILSIEETFHIKLKGDELYRYSQLLALYHCIFDDHHDSVIEEVVHKFYSSDDLLLKLPTPNALSKNKMKTHHRQNTKSILLTGATGYLGSFLLDALLNTHTQSHIYCLIRPKDELTVQDRILHTQSSYGLDNQFTIEQRCTLVEGDLAKPYLNLSQEVYQQLSQKIDIIIHCAAEVHLQLSYHHLVNNIVNATRNLLYFACLDQIKTFHHISTNGIFPLQLDPSHAQHYKETHDITHLDTDLEMGYSQAKWVAERLVQQANHLGLPCSIYRLGNIGPHRRLAIFNAHDLTMLVFQACLSLGKAPLTTHWTFEMIPVDRHVQVIMHALKKECKDHIEYETYHIVQASPYTAQHIFTMMQQQHYIQEMIPLEQWRQELLIWSQKNQHKACLVLAHHLYDLSIHLQDKNRFDTTHTNKLMHNEDFIMLEDMDYLQATWDLMLST